VIIYDFPIINNSVEADYLFQISLAGYCSHPGNSYLLYTEKDLPRAQELIDIMNELQQVTHWKFDKFAKIIILFSFYS
jgi:hypothetical protein